jgi:predicted TIM-barrel enzyme
MTRGEILAAWARRRPLRGRTGSGGQADFRVLDTTLRFGSPQAALLPLGDANAILLELARERPDDAPVLAGVCATDPLRLMDRFVAELRALGFTGVINSPSVGWIDGSPRRSLEETGLGYAKEVELVKIAREADLVAVALAFTPDEAVLMVRAGADVVVSPPDRLAAVAKAVREARAGLPVLVYGPEPLEDGALAPASSATTGTSPSTTRAKRS